ncbi:MAG: chain-length determining protein [Muribaculaceae bacterium]|nr:chain-length determining protein [Muribaculaceae bacterium]
MEEINIENFDNSEEKDIDLTLILKKLLQNKKMILLWCLAGLVLGLIIAVSIPREYQTSVTLAPEANGNKSSNSNLGALAAMAGVNIGSSGADAVSPQLYPDIVKSAPFSLSLLNVRLTDKDEKRKFTVAEYLENDVKSPWWSVITGAPGMIIGALSGGGDNKEENIETATVSETDPLVISTKESQLLGALNGRLNVAVDIKTSIVTISVRMQDPMVSAILADSVAKQLKEYITDYRTNKARQDLEYIEKLNAEAKQKYYEAQQKYANYLDTHQGIVLYSAQTMSDRLENEATLAFNMFNQTSQQLQMAKAKVQEETPVFATINPATVPVKPVAPRKVLIIVGFIFLAFVAACVWILLIQPLRRQLKEDTVSNEEKAKTWDSTMNE